MRERETDRQTETETSIECKRVNFTSTEAQLGNFERGAQVYL